MEGRCREKGVVYEARLEVEGEKVNRRYIGATATSFKDRWANHRKSFIHERYSNSTALAKEIWRRREEGKLVRTSWRIVERAAAYTPAAGKCQLCLAEKTRIITDISGELLNSRNEIMNKCRHRNRFLLENWAPD